MGKPSRGIPTKASSVTAAHLASDNTRRTDLFLLTQDLWRGAENEAVKTSRVSTVRTEYILEVGQVPVSVAERPTPPEGGMRDTECRNSCALAVDIGPRWDGVRFV